MIVPVEEQRVVGPAFDGPVVEPGVLIADTPKVDTTDLITVLVVNLKEIQIPLSDLLVSVSEGLQSPWENR